VAEVFSKGAGKDLTSSHQGHVIGMWLMACVALGSVRKELSQTLHGTSQ
jgi:hypothetical protein